MLAARVHSRNCSGAAGSIGRSRCPEAGAPPAGGPTSPRSAVMEAQRFAGQPHPQGLYDPAREHDACGVGFVVDVKGKKSHAIVRQALEVLINLLHRGACGSEPNTGDGAGILLQMPDKFFRKECARLGIPLPAPSEYGAGLVFLPPAPVRADKVRTLIQTVIVDEGQRCLGWRAVPTDDRLLGATAVSVEPRIVQVFVGRGASVRDHAHFERKLYVIRKRIEHALAGLSEEDRRVRSP